MDLYKTGDGRYLWARWDDRSAQYTSTMGVGVPQGYCYSFARTLSGLAGVVKTWRTREAALTAGRRAGFGDKIGD